MFNYRFLYKPMNKVRVFFLKIKNEDILSRITSFFYVIFFYLLSKPVSKKNIWLIGENAGDCLQDNGYYFYKYCRELHPEHPVFFIIKKSSPFFSIMCTDNHVICYGSYRHIALFFSAHALFYTHNFKDILYKRLFNIFRRNQKLVYLHHGVLGFKKFDDFYYKNRNAMDNFIVGSELEKNILINQVGIEQEKVKAIGYARYDHLKNNITSKSIVYIPTHRRIVTTNIEKTDFFSKIQSLINNAELCDYLENKNITLYYYLHQAMSSFIDKFSCNHPNVKIIKYGETTPLQFINNCSLMITDYSSVSWDFFYLGKPVIFYRFDIDEYISDRGSYIDLYENIIGDVVINEEQVISLLKQYECNDFEENENYRKYRNNIMPYIDQNNCQRIYCAANELNNTESA